MVFQDVAEVYNEAGLKHLCPTGTSVLLEGTLTETPEGKKQVHSLMPLNEPQHLSLVLGISFGHWVYTDAVHVRIA